MRRNLTTARNLFALVLVMSCGGNKPEPPDPEAYKKLDPTGRCEATMPRAVRCINHLMYEEAVAAGLPPADAKEIVEKAADKPSRPGDDEAVYKVQCLGDKDPNALPDAVLACWKIDGCKLFAKCVTEKRKR
jgi:hypothetical protein